MSDKATTDSEPPAKDYNDLKHHVQELTGAIASDSTGDEAGWMRTVQAAAHELFEALEHHEDVTEEEGGTLPEMTGEKPALMVERKRLERDHTEMLQRAEELEEEVERQVSFDSFNVEIVRLEASILLDILKLHLLRTDRLMYEAYFQVEGGESG